MMFRNLGLTVALLMTGSIGRKQLSKRRFCIKVYDPVCGYDGKTYSNTCEAGGKANVECKGECPCKKENVCDEPAGVTGQCFGSFTRWTFNKKKGRCEKFIYGGCNGNGNNFMSLAACQQRCGNCGPKDCNIRCRKEERCWKDPTIVCKRAPCCPKWSCKPSLPCRIPARFCRAPYAPVCGIDGCEYDNQCEADRHGVKIKCKGKCPCEPVQKPCDQPKGVKGPCEAWYLRWTYDKNVRKCEKFIYGGCRGNDNRFKTKAECEDKCVKSKQGCNNDLICRVWYPPNWSGARVTPDVKSCPSDCMHCSHKWGIPPPQDIPRFSYCLNYFPA